VAPAASGPPGTPAGPGLPARGAPPGEWRIRHAYPRKSATRSLSAAERRREKRAEHRQALRRSGEEAPELRVRGAQLGQPDRDLMAGDPHRERVAADLAEHVERHAPGEILERLVRA
jgi:hypothetical protein